MSSSEGGRLPKPLYLELTYLGEQVGALELDLSTRLSSVFGDRFPTIHRAYLARAIVKGADREGVVLAIADGGGSKRDEIIQTVAAVFASRFNVDQALDVVFVSSADEVRIGEVCRPFFESQSVRNGGKER